MSVDQPLLSSPTPRETPPAWLPPTARALEDILQLPENWNSYGARRIDPEVAAAALTLLNQTMARATPPPIVTPTNRGGIVLEWHTRGIDLEIELVSTSRFHVFYEDDHTGQQWEDEVGTDFTPSAGYLADLARRHSS